MSVMRRFDLMLSPWKWQGVVLVGGTPEEASAWARKVLGIKPNIGDGSVGHAYVEYGLPWLLWMKSEKDMPTLAHEALHIASGVLEGRGLKFSSDSEEAYTYTLEFIVRSVQTCRAWKRASR